MEAKAIKIFENIFQNQDNVQFKIPVYQRKYSWKIDNVKRLIEDIIRTQNSDYDHFTGTIIYKKISNDLILIDGQQRLITISLILKAISLLDNNFKFNNKKIVACKEDDREYHRLMILEKYESNDENSQLFENFNYIYEEVEHSIDLIKNGLEKLTCVEIILENNEDPQEVFESINSLGLKLSPSDLIRNYLLMSFEYNAQDNLYESCWKTMQYDMIGEDYLEEYINNFIMFRTESILRFDDVYKTYVDYAKGKDHKLLLEELHEYSNYYKYFICIDEKHKDLCLLMREIRDMDQTTPFPFLLHIFDDCFINKIINEETLKKVINLVIVYLVRRTVCQNSSSSGLRKYFVELYKNVFSEVPSNKEEKNYYRSIYKYMTQSNSKYNNMPNENEFVEKLKSYRLYTNKKFGTYLLSVVEVRRYKNLISEQLKVEDCSIEHIMPQTLIDDWCSMLGEDYQRIHDTYVHTIGNLSLSSRDNNSSYSNKSFLEKKRLIEEKASHFHVLNKEIEKNDTFNENVIIDRANRLIGIVKEQYHLEDVDTIGITFERVNNIKTDINLNCMYLKTKIVSYSFESDRIERYEDTAINYFDLFRKVMRMVYEKYPDEVKKLADDGYKIWEGSKPVVYYGTPANPNDKLSDELALEFNYSNDYLVQLLSNILNKVGINPEGLVINYKELDNFDQQEVRKKKYIVRKAVEVLGKNDKILDEIDNSSTKRYVKFNTKSLKNTFSLTDGSKIEVNKFEMNYNAYLEYYIPQKCIYLTLKYRKHEDKFNILKNNIELLNLEPYQNDNWYWHIKKYDIDTTKVDKNDFIGSFITLLDEYLPIINKDIDDICNFLKLQKNND